MKNLFAFFISIFCVITFSVAPVRTVHAQLTVTQGAALSMTPLQLVQQVLVGSGITVSNATLNGSAASITVNFVGSFTTAGTATTQLGFTGGIILASGNASNAIGPNTSESTTTALSTGSDPDLQLLIPSHTVYDKAILEFDFIPISDTVRFRYVFGSEEFDEFCNSSFNDVFGFFISGPGITGPFSGNAKNIALMPNNPANYVTIDNVCNAGATYSWLNTGGTFYQYDRLTTVYTAWSVVQPCQTYHIKLAVGDAGDSSYDSGVFLEENSFSSYGLSYNTSFSSNVDTAAVEGCNDAIVCFRLGQPDNVPIVIHYTVTGTAIEGVDYPNVADSLIIPAGQDSAYFIIHPISDGLAEPDETVHVIYINTVCGSTDTITIVIKDYTPLSTTVTPEVKNCNGLAANINVTASGGFTTAAHGLSYEWSNGAGNTASVSVNPSTPTMYYVTVSDACFFFNDSTSYYTVDSVMVSISNLATAIINVDSVTCFGYSDGTATISASNGLQPYHYIWSPTNDTTTTVDSLPAGTYFVTVTDNIGCTSATFVILDSPPEIVLDLQPTDETCLDSCNGSITTQVTGNYSQPVSYLWSTTPAQNTANITNLCAGNYTVTFTYSVHNCFVVENADIITGTPITADFTATPDSGFVPLTVQFQYTGSGAVNFLWDFGDGSPTSTVQDPLHIYENKGTYTATLLVNSGPPNFCEATYLAEINVIHPSSMKVPNLFTPNSDGVNDVFQVESEGINTLEIAIFNRWGKKIYSGSFSDFSTSKVTTDLWDGTSKSEGKCADGTYYYILDAVGDDLKEYHMQGTISLMR